MDVPPDTDYSQCYMLKKLVKYNMTSRKKPNRPDEYYVLYCVYNQNDVLIAYREEYNHLWITRGEIPSGETVFSRFLFMSFFFNEVSYYQKPPLPFEVYKKRMINFMRQKIEDLNCSMENYNYTKGEIIGVAYLAESIETHRMIEKGYIETYSICKNEQNGHEYLACCFEITNHNCPLKTS